MANYRAVANGNWSSGATWGGGAVPPNGAGHNIFSNNFTVTIDTNVDVAQLSNFADSSTFVGGGTATIGGGFKVDVTGLQITANLNARGTTLLTFNAASPAILSVTGNVVGCIAGTGNVGILNASSGSILITGSVTGGSTVTNTGHGVSSSAGSITVVGQVYGGLTSLGILTSGSTVLTITGDITASAAAGVSHGTGQLTITGNCTASVSANAVVSTGTNNKISGNFISASNGFLPIYARSVVLDSPPLVAKTRYALNGSSTFVDMFTADNSLGQANPTDVRSGVSYASGTLTGRLTVPARGSVALSVAYGPSMPFTATRSGTTATATLTYSYPLVVGDQITVTGASNSEWNSTYTITSIVSGTSVTFEVPASHSSTAGTGAVMQTTGTAALDSASITSAVQAALTAQGLTTARAGNLDNLDATVSSRLAPSGTLATVTTLTNAPSVPSASAIASQVRTELSVELGRVDAAISTRATPANIPTSDITAIKAKTDALNTTRLAQVSTTEIVGNLLAQANS